MQSDKHSDAAHNATDVAFATLDFAMSRDYIPERWRLRGVNPGTKWTRPFWLRAIGYSGRVYQLHPLLLPRKPTAAMSEGHLVVLVRSDISQQLRDRAAISPAAQVLIKSISDYGIELHPLHGGVEDPELGRYFFSSAAALDDPVAVARSLAQLEGVEASYYKPPDEAP